MLSLDKAIKSYEKIAEENEKDAEQFKRIKATEDIASYCYECAKEHRQLAEWLRKLKAYEEARKEIIRKMNSGQWSEGVVYGLDKAVRIMEKHVEEVNTDEDSD